LIFRFSWKTRKNIKNKINNNNKIHAESITTTTTTIIIIIVEDSEWRHAEV